MNDTGGQGAWGYFPPEVIPEDGERAAYVTVEDAVAACKHCHDSGKMDGALAAFQGLARLNPVKLLLWQWRARRLLRKL